MKVQASNDSKTPTTTYNAFLLRCWHSDEEWRFSLEDVATHQRHVAVGSQAMVALLMEQLADLIEDGKVG